MKNSDASSANNLNDPNYLGFIAALMLPYALFLVAAFGVLSMMINQNNYADTSSHIQCFLTPTDYEFLFYLQALNDKSLLYTPSVIISEQGLETAVVCALTMVVAYYVTNGLSWLKSRMKGENKPYHSFFPSLTFKNIITFLIGVSAYCFMVYTAISVSTENVANQNKYVKVAGNYLKVKSNNGRFYEANEAIFNQCSKTSNITLIPSNQKSYVSEKR